MPSPPRQRPATELGPATATPSAVGGTRGRLVVLAVGTVVDALSALALPMALGAAVDAMVSGRPVGRWVTLAVALVVAGIAGDLAATFAATAYVANTTARLRDRLVQHVLAVCPGDAARFGPGDLAARVCGNAVDAAQLGPSFVLVVSAVLPPAGSLALLAAIDPVLGAAFLAAVALVGLVLRAFARRTAGVVADYQRVQGRLAGLLAESLTGARTVAAAGTVRREEDRVLEPLGALRAHGERMWRVVSRASAQATVAGLLVLVAVLAAGGIAVVDGRISAGDLLAASRYAMLGAGLGGLTGILGRLARARAGRQRTGDVLAIEPMPYGESALPAVTAAAAPGQLELRHVTVRGHGGVPLLDRVHVTVPGGAIAAVVGRSGAGKSVFAALVARLRDPDLGDVLLDGVPLRELRREVLRGAVGCAFERPVLVGGTVADAIGLGLDADRVRASARATHAHDFVSRLPRGYDTPLSRAPMSGGEAQRLGLARAWHADRLLVLDDATSSLDVVTEMQIGHTLLGEAAPGTAGRTRIVVTHRAATAARADLVVWLEAGRVRAVGPHGVLWSEPGYREVFG